MLINDTLKILGKGNSMSVQFGRWNFEGQPAATDYIEKVSAALAPYGPDSNESYSNGDILILYRAFHTTKESRRETQPYVCQSGSVLTLDGRLDNRTNLIDELRSPVTVESTDIAIVAAAYSRWKRGCLAKLIGDWALSIWDPTDRSLVLAKDPIGARHLYYSIERDHVTWSTILDPLVLFAGKTFALNEEYVAGWFSMFPATHLTPYAGLHAVPPSSTVLLRSEKHIVRKYWDFDPTKRVRYQTDAEYEEHFRTVFAKAVQRSLRSDSPILAELSGGRDSSSIVCMADTIMAHGAAEAPRLDTLSMYDDSEPNWNERPYFTKVEEKRGHSGWHIDVGSKGRKERNEAELHSESPNVRFAAVPGKGGRSWPEFAKCIISQQNRVVLSGIAGDEVMGGVPTPTPELEDLMATCQLKTLAHSLKVWALEQRKPWFHLFLQAAKGFFPPTVLGVAECVRPPAWLKSDFVRRHRAPLTGYPSRLRLFGPPPSFQESVSTLDALRRQLACNAPPLDPPYEKRYPYLDRDLLEFMFSVPPEQLVRPTQRRSLMRRALVGIVPDEILNKKSKAFVVRTPLVTITNEWTSFVETTQDMVSSSLGIVDSELLLATLEKGRRGEEIPTVALMRTISVENWLKSLRASGYLDVGAASKSEPLFRASALA